MVTEGFRTKDIYQDGMKEVGTDEMGDEVIKKIRTILTST